MRRLIIIVVVLTFAALAMYSVWHDSSVEPLRMRAAEDVVQLAGNPGSHSATIVLDGRRASCVDDEIARTTNTAGVGNFLSPSQCDGRVAVLVQDRAMYFENAASWTDDTGDTLPVSLAAMPQLPVSIWTPTGGTSDAQVHIGAARPIYNDMQCGVGFEEVVPIEVRPALDGLPAGCSDLSAVKGAGYADGRLNVYYVQEIRDAVDARGVHCATDSTVILISVSTGVLATLSHEVGHALSLGHTNTIDGLNTYTETEPGLAVCNLMLQSGVNQRLLSTGQCFRCNLNSSSALNALGARTGPVPGCAAVASSPVCPAISFDVVPK